MRQIFTHRASDPTADQANAPANNPPHHWIKTTVLVVGFAAAMLATNAVASAVENPALSVIVGVALPAAMISLYVWVGTRIEKRAVAEVEARAGVRHLLVGLAAGLGLAAATIGLMAAFGAYRITGWGSATAALAVVGTMCAVAVAEEVFFRGVVFRLLQGRWGVIIALLGSSLLFGLLHLLNPDASLVGALSIAIEAGLMLGAAYILTGSLWLAIGLHLGWNVAIGAIFGTVVSGSDARDALFVATTSGPDWLSGGTFGPEASIVAIVVCSVMTAALLFIAHRRGRFSLKRR